MSQLFADPTNHVNVFESASILICEESIHKKVLALLRKFPLTFLK